MKETKEVKDTSTNQYNQYNQYSSDIAAKIHISESEIILANNEYTYDDFTKNPKKYHSVLYDLGLDTNFNFVFQPTCLHRNRLNKVVICGRFYGDERTDKDWIGAGYASQAAKDKASNCRLVDEMYQQRGLTQTAQVAGELKDSYEANDKDAVEGLLELCKDYEED